VNLFNQRYLNINILKTNKIPAFVEVSFSMPFYDIYFEDESWDESKFKKCPTELLAICKALDIHIDTNFLYDEYNKNLYVGGDIHIFYSKENADMFIYFDLQRDKFDQMAMVFIGIRFRVKDLASIKEKILSLYFKATVHTDLTEDYFSNKLSKISKQQNQTIDRIIHHYNLKP
jgi:hypothetical protein